MRRTGLLTAIVVVGLAVAGVAAQRGGGRGGGGGIPPTGAIRNVRGNLYIIPGQGPNTAVLVTKAGVVLVDTKLASYRDPVTGTTIPNGEAILKQVRTVTDLPVTMIINTHSHPDHNGSNDYFPPAVEVVTHANLQKRVAANQKTAALPNMLPDKTFTDRLSLGSGADRIDLYYFGAGHTDNDSFVVFPAQRVMHAGDQMAWNMAPLIDPAAGGSVIALADTLEKAVKGIPNVELVIEGHDEVITWAGFVEYTRFNRALLEAAKAGLGKRTPEDIANDLRQRFPTQTKDEMLPGVEYGGTPLSRAVINVNVAFQELKGEPVTTNFGPPRGGGAGRGAEPGRGGDPGRGGEPPRGGGPPASEPGR
jgi:glyoxylase-like metal-dependent hydrolase (beta-lactamase superfamily II)